MKRKRFSVRTIGLILIVAAAVAAFLFLVVLPSRQAWQYASILSSALNNARSVTLVEFYHDIFGPELVFSRAPASSQQIADLRAATGAWIAPIPPWSMLCFDPHHRVEIVRSDGSTLRFDICFHCQNFTLGDSEGATLPGSWRDRLAKLFSDAGMPPREDYSNLIKKHPDYHLIEEARDALGKQADKTPEPPQQ